MLSIGMLLEEGRKGICCKYRFSSFLSLPVVDKKYLSRILFVYFLGTLVDFSYICIVTNKNRML